MVTNIIIDNLFTDSDINFINKILIDNPDKIKEDDPDRGRDGLDLREYLENSYIHTKVENYIKNKYSDSFYLTGYYYVEYNTKYINPNLPPHSDPTNNILNLDYQLDANTEWPICANGECFTLKNNQAFAFGAAEQIHWRPHKIFNENEYVRMIFFHFKDINNPVLHQVTEEQMRESIPKWKHLL